VTETFEQPVVRTGREGLFLSSSAIRLTRIEPTEARRFCCSYSRMRPHPIILSDSIGNQAISLSGPKATWHYV
jgi:hypothetical protein